MTIWGPAIEEPQSSDREPSILWGLEVVKLREFRLFLNLYPRGIR